MLRKGHSKIGSVGEEFGLDLKVFALGNYELALDRLELRSD